MFLFRHSGHEDKGWRLNWSHNYFVPRWSNSRGTGGQEGGGDGEGKREAGCAQIVSADHDNSKSNAPKYPFTQL